MKRRTSRFGRFGAIALLLSILAVAAGCNRSLDRATGRGWWRLKSPPVYMKVALESEQADLRRQAVGKVISSRQVTRDWAFAGLAAIARGDENVQVRCVAFRGLIRYSDDRPIAVAIDVLGEGEPGPNGWADDDVRWEALRLVDDFGDRGLIPDAQRDALRDALARHLDARHKRDVRQAAAAGLRHFADRAALSALIEALKDSDFGVVLRTERSLAMLTGLTHHYDPDEWHVWLTSAADPFASAGQMPESLAPPRQTWWERTKRVFGR